MNETNDLGIRWVYGGLKIGRIQCPAENIQSLPKDAGVFVNEYKPLTDEVLSQDLKLTQIWVTPKMVDQLVEQARRSNELYFAVASYLANQCEENFELLKQARKLYRGQITLHVYLGK